MAKKVAPPKLTGGGGFVFEDAVAAYYLSCLLVARPPLDPALGMIVRIDFQARVDGWFLDDVLLTLSAGPGERQCALSVKSNQQFTKDAPPPEFVELAWEQFLHHGTARFDRERDLLGLVVAPLPAELSAQLSELLRWARDQDPRTLPGRLVEPGFASDPKRALFAGFACPPTLAAEYGVTEERTGELLARIRVIECDFDRDQSSWLAAAHQNCRDAVRDGAAGEALALWERLLAIAAEYRPAAGYLDLPRLLDLLRGRFRIADHPDHRADWQRLLADTRDTLAAIPDTVGGRVALPRAAEHAALDAALAEGRAVALLGPSGDGKTVLAKRWAEAALAGGKVIWLDARDGDLHDLPTLPSRLGLRAPLRELLASAPDERATLVVDGLDRVFEDRAFRHLATLLRQLRWESAASPWHLLVTCQPEDWERVQLALLRANVPRPGWRVLDVREPDPAELDAVWDVFPALRRLTLQPHLRSLLLKPKILDLLATRLAVGGAVDTSRWVGESDLVAWFWESEVRRPPATTRARLLMRLGEAQADTLQARTPVDAFGDLDLTALDGLQSERLCEVREERVSFGHDLYGDWARQRALLAHQDALREYVGLRLISPAWHRAIRLYGLHLLEQQDDAEAWRATVDLFDADDGGDDTARDLLVEAVIFAADPPRLLALLWPDLTVQGGRLLRRFLRRFLHVATRPDPRLLALARDLGPDWEARAATMQRLPYWPHWLPVLRFLHERAAEALALAPEEIATVADTWLRQGHPEWPLRREAADLALAEAERILRVKGNDRSAYGWGGLDKVVYRAAVAGAPDLPDRVTAFSLAASARRALEPAASGDEGTSGNSAAGTIADTDDDDRKVDLPPPWPDGPGGRVDEAFRDICLETDALYLLILSRPSVAREVLLALLIQPPRRRRRAELMWPMFEEDFDIAHVRAWFPPFYTRGPLLFFLTTRTTEGVATIIRLVNFATERWAERRREEGEAPSDVVINLPTGDSAWAGDEKVYFWYEDYTPCPQPIVVALMALEKWFYDELAAERSVDATIELLLRESRSVAFAGLLRAVGRKEPALFGAVLRPLFLVPEFHIWEQAHRPLSEEMRYLGWLYHDQDSIKRAREWYDLPHRKIDLDRLALHLFLNVPPLRPFFEEARARWVALLDASEVDDTMGAILRRLVAWYDMANWSVRQDSDGPQQWVFTPPEALRAGQQVADEVAERLRLLIFPTLCAQRIETGRALSEDEAERFWDELQGLPSSPSVDAVTSDVWHVDDALCGGAAVLLTLNRDWLRRHPEREAWCRAQLLATVQNPLPRSQFDNPAMMIDGSWDMFCARAIPILWAETPDTPDLREAMALLTVGYHHRAVAALFATAAGHRATLGRHFGQLQHLVLRWAAARWSVTGDEAESRLLAEVAAFIDGTIPPQTPPWADLTGRVADPGRRYVGYMDGRPRQDPGLDLEVIQAAYAWLPALDQAIDATERAEWLRFWGEALGSTLWMLGTGIARADAEGDDDEIDGTPYTWDRWVLPRVAGLIVQMRPEERPETFWQPVLRLSAPGRYWIEEFLRGFFHHSLRSEGADEAFERSWRAMVEWALTASEWSFAHTGYGYRLGELWNYLLGLDRSVRDRWTDAQRPVIRRMWDLYEQWATEGLRRRDCAAAFLSFLQRPATEDIRLDGLVWFEGAARQARQRYFWEQEDMQGRAASLLDLCWRTHQADLRRQPVHFEAFKRLLARLAEFQDPVALELQQRLVALAREQPQQ